jgi:hypothetical protein
MATSISKYVAILRKGDTYKPRLNSASTKPMPKD